MQYVKMHHDEFGEADVVEESVSVWLDKGWEVVPVEQVAAEAGEVPPEVAPASEASTSDPKASDPTA